MIPIQYHSVIECHETWFQLSIYYMQIMPQCSHISLYRKCFLTVCHTTSNCSPSNNKTYLFYIHPTHFPSSIYHKLSSWIESAWGRKCLHQCTWCHYNVSNISTLKEAVSQQYQAMFYMFFHLSLLRLNYLVFFSVWGIMKEKKKHKQLSLHEKKKFKKRYAEELKSWCHTKIRDQHSKFLKDRKSRRVLNPM